MGANHGRFNRNLNVVVPATRALRLEEVVDLGAYDVGAAQEEPLFGVTGEDFGVTRSSARALILEGLQNDTVAELSLRMKGRELRRPKVEVMLTGLLTRRLLLPAWVMSYRYANKKFRVIIHGQRPWVVVGTSPISVWRVAAALASALGLVAVLIILLMLYRRFH